MCTSVRPLFVRLLSNRLEILRLTHRHHPSQIEKRLVHRLQHDMIATLHKNDWITILDSQ